MKTKVFVVLEEYNNDGEIKVDVISVNSTFEKAQKSMHDKFEQYKSYGVFEEDDFKNAEVSTEDDSMYVYAECDDYYGKLDIIEKEIEWESFGLIGFGGS